MAQANAVFLSLVSGVALVLGLAPGCSGNSAPTPQVAMVWTVDQGPNVGTCGAVNDTWSIGDTTKDPIATVTAGASVNNVPVSVTCSVTANADGYEVHTYVAYGLQGSLTISGEIKVASGATPATQSGLDAQFDDAVPHGLIANLEDKNCTVSFPRQGMGISTGMVWGEIDCTAEADANGTVCEGKAEFLFESCGQ